MEFKIAVIGNKMYGDIGLVVKDKPVQEFKGFRDIDLEALITKGQNNFAINDVTVKDRDGRQQLRFGHIR